MLNPSKMAAGRKAPKKAPNPVGAPTLYKPEYVQMCKDDMAAGYTLTAFAGSIGVTRKCVYEWAERYPEFGDAFKSGQAKRQRHWETELMDRESQPAKTIFALKNCCREDWAERNETVLANPDGKGIHDALAIAVAQQIHKQTKA